MVGITSRDAVENAGFGCTIGVGDEIDATFVRYREFARIRVTQHLAGAVSKLDGVLTKLADLRIVRHSSRH